MKLPPDLVQLCVDDFKANGTVTEPVSMAIHAWLLANHGAYAAAIGATPINWAALLAVLLPILIQLLPLLIGGG